MLIHACYRLCASSPNEPTHQEALRVAAEELRDITASAPILRKKLIGRLEVNITLLLSKYFIRRF